MNIENKIAIPERMDLPLNGYRVLNLADEKGAFCGKILSDLGADVIKIEPPEGDPARKIGPFFHGVPNPDRSLFWFAYYTNQRSITLNINTYDGQRIFRELAKKSAFIIESFTPGYLAELGLGCSHLIQINPALIFTSISPYGQSGPKSQWKASDLVLSGEGMSMSLIGDPDRAPLRMGGTEQSYLVAGAYAAAATMIAHYHRELTGKGQHVDISAQESVIFTTLGLYLFEELEGYSLHRTGNYSPRWGKEEKQVWQCKDGYIMWVPFLSMQGRYTRNMVEWMDSERQAEDLISVQWEKIGYEEIDVNEYKRWQEVFARFIKRHTKAEFRREAFSRNLLLFPVNDPEELLNDEQLYSRAYWQKINYPEFGTQIIHPGAAYKLSQCTPVSPVRAPLPGEHNLEIYKEELGLTTGDLCLMKQANVI